MASKWKSREELKKEKELDEARKAGTVAPLTDEHGNDISPHIPQYIAAAPWYFKKDDTPTLVHQRLLQKKEFDKQWYQRGVRGPTATKYRPGCCANCGAKGHAEKDCLERPRAKGAKFTNKDIKPDDIETPKLDLGYEGSRDRWNGYDPNEHVKVYELYQKLEEERRKKRQEEVKQSVTESDNKVVVNPTSKAVSILLQDDDEEEDDEQQDDGVHETGTEDQIGSKVDGRTRTTIRHLRIREDTAKYLINLDPESAFYDAKTRSMRANPLPHKDPRDLDFAGENFVRQTGSAKEFSEIELYTYKAHQMGRDDVHMQAAPSQLERIYREEKQKKQESLNEEKEKILSKYGGEEHLKKVPKALLLGQTEQYVEYSADGKVIKGTEVIPRSKWVEDVFPVNHTSIWGSFWKDGKWGYQCCWQFEKNAYCTGEEGKRASQIIRHLNDSSKNNNNNDNDDDDNGEKYQKINNNNAAMLEKMMNTTKRGINNNNNGSNVDSRFEDEKKRKYNSFSAGNNISEDEIENYHRKRLREDDPMKDFI